MSDERDVCFCGAIVRPSWTSEPKSDDAPVIQRASCTSCGLQLIRTADDERWRHIRG